MLQPRVFISSVTRELSNARERVAQRLRLMGFDVDFENEWGTSPGNLLEEIRDRVVNADIFLQLVGRFAGAHPNPGDQDHPGATFTQLELWYAKKHRKDDKNTILIFVDPDVSDDPQFAPSAKEAAQQDSYRQALTSSGLIFHKATTEAELLAKVSEIDWLHRRIQEWFDIWKTRGGPQLILPSDTVGHVKGFSLATFHATNRWLPWKKREKEERLLEGFLDDDRPFLWWVLTGEGGVGKSRLALEFMLRRREKERRWTMGFLPPSDVWWQGNTDWVPLTNTLIVCDYAASRRNWTDVLFKLGRLFTEARSYKCRVLLLTRPDGFPSFLLGNQSRARFGEVRRCLYNPFFEAARQSPEKKLTDDALLARREEALELKVEQKTLKENLERVLTAIATEVCANPGEVDMKLQEWMAKLPADDQEKQWKEIVQKTGHGRWLLLQIFAWLHYLKHDEANGDHRNSDFDMAGDLESLLQAYLVREIRRNWKTHSGSARLDEEDPKDRILTTLALATLQRGLNRTDFEKLEELRKNKPKQRAILWRKCQQVLGRDQLETTLQPVEPDLVGEALLIQVLTSLGWDDEAPGDGYFVPGFAGNSLTTPGKLVEVAVEQERGRDGLAYTLGLVRRDFASNPVVLSIFDAVRELVLKDDFVPTDNLLAALFDYGWGEYDDEQDRPTEFARQLLSGLLERPDLQQYLYDTGLLIRYSAYLEEVAERDTRDLERLVALKLLAHSEYRKASQSEDFTEVIRHLDRLKETADWVRPWYMIFINDHVANNLARKDSFPQIEDEERSQYDRCLKDTIEALPESLITADEPPQTEDLPLLLRAAHFWGHVGNQATRRMDFHVRVPAEPDEIKATLDDGKQAFLRAAVLRLAAYKTSFLPEIQEHSDDDFMAALDGIRTLTSDEGKWLEEFSLRKIEKGPRERFLHRSQSIGDMAHQLGGAAKLHFQAIQALWRKAAEHSWLKSQHEEGERCIQAADKLWERSLRMVKQERGTPLQYYIWHMQFTLMCKMTRMALAGRMDELRSLDLERELDEWFSQTKKLGIHYPFAEDTIKKTLGIFRESLLSQ